LPPAWAGPTDWPQKSASSIPPHYYLFHLVKLLSSLLLSPLSDHGFLRRSGESGAVHKPQCLLSLWTCLLTPVSQTITDLDDFLTPSQACIIPVRQTNKPASQADGRDPNVSSSNGGASVVIHTS
jgi:hypothetical protein